MWILEFGTSKLVLRQSLVLGFMEFGWHALSLPRACGPAEVVIDQHELVPSHHAEASERATLKARATLELELDDPLALTEFRQY
jgi:hypothetical protein